MQHKSGLLLMAVAVLHEVVGIVFYFDTLVDIGEAGIINTINPPHWQRDAAFWFLMFGAMLFFYGWIAQWLINQAGSLPAFWGWALLGLCTTGVIFMPASGFWLGMPVAWLMIQYARRQSIRPQLA